MTPKGRKKKLGRGELTPLEVQIMQVIWEHGDATAAEIAEAIKDERPLADTTIHTVLANLRKKGAIEPIPTIERAMRFKPKVERDEVASRSLRRMLTDYFGGSPKKLLVHLLNDEEIDEKELKEIRRMLDETPEKEGRDQ